MRKDSAYYSTLFDSYDDRNFQYTLYRYLFEMEDDRKLFTQHTLNALFKEERAGAIEVSLQQVDRFIVYLYRTWKWRDELVWSGQAEWYEQFKYFMERERVPDRYMIDKRSFWNEFKSKLGSSFKRTTRIVVSPLGDKRQANVWVALIPVIKDYVTSLNVSLEVVE